MVKKTTYSLKVTTFGFVPGRILAKKYAIISLLGAGWEGEVYKIRECSTGIERTAKFFFPHRDPLQRRVSWYAKKLHKLRNCPIVIQYHTHEIISFRKMEVHGLISEYIEGELLSSFIQRQPGKRLTPFQGLHLLYSLAHGMESVHHLREYHGDLHAENIIVRRFGIGFDLKLLDMFHWKTPKQENIDDDVCSLIRIFYDAIGGKKYYAKHVPEVKNICCGLKRGLILSKFKTAGRLREYLETMQWA